MKLISAQSKFVVKTFFKRDYDHFTPDGQKNIDRMIMVADVLIVLGLIFLL